MTINIPRPRSILLVAATASLTACAASPSAAPAALQEQVPPVARPAMHGGSWMLPEAKRDDLLYVNNVYTITVYSYPHGKLVGTLSDFYKPFGDCADSKGDVYITDSSFGATYVYAHGGTKPIRTLKDPNYHP